MNIHELSNNQIEKSYQTMDSEENTNPLIHECISIQELLKEYQENEIFL